MNNPVANQDALTKEFYNGLWGNNTLQRSVWYGQKGNPPDKKCWFADTTKALTFAKTLGQNYNVYHSCALFNAPRRKKDNAEKVNAIWLDLDLKGSQFAEVKELAKDAFTKLTGTQFANISWMVSTGHGVHFYWVFERPVTPDEWKQLAELLYKICRDKSIHADHARTRDIASIMRCPNSYNLKGDQPKPVKLVKTNASPIDPNNLLKEMAQETAIPPANRQPYPKQNYDADLIATKCAVIGEFKRTGLHGNEPAWALAMNVIRFCKDGDEKVHEYSKKDKDYNEAETANKLKSKNNSDAKPTLCTTCAEHGYCKDCPHKETIKTPLRLGWEIPQDLISNECLKKIVNEKQSVYCKTLPALAVDLSKKHEAKITIKMVDDYISEKRKTIENAKLIKLDFLPLDLTIIKLCVKDKRKPQKTLLLEIADQIKLFHDEEKTPYSMYYNGEGGRCVYAVGSKDFSLWLQYVYFLLTQDGCNENSLKEAISTIKAQALYTGNKHIGVFLRTARVGEKIYVDLCNDAWQVVEITANKWQILDNSPVLFTRNKNMLPLPIPKRNGTLDRLWEIINVPVVYRPLVYGWLLSSYRSLSPRPILNIQGEEGSGKSQASGYLRGLIDPNTSNTKYLTIDERDLTASMNNNAILCFDNVSAIPPQISDWLCRVSSGEGFSARMLYTDNEEIVYKGKHPIILNSIVDIVTRPDLVRRCFTLHLEPITRAKTSKELDTIYEENKPYILGAIYDLVAGALKHENTIIAENKDRTDTTSLVDALCFVTAAERGSTSLKENDFKDIYIKEINLVAIDAIEASPMANLVYRLITDNTKPRYWNWKGTISELLTELMKNFPCEYGQLYNLHQWPSSARGLANIFSRYINQFRKVGIKIKSTRGNGENIKHILNTNKVMPSE